MGKLTICIDNAGPLWNGELFKSLINSVKKFQRAATKKDAARQIDRQAQEDP